MHTQKDAFFTIFGRRLPSSAAYYLCQGVWHDVADGRLSLPIQVFGECYESDRCALPLHVRSVWLRHR